MTKRYPLGSAFSGGNSGNTRNLQRIAFGRFAAAHLLECSATNMDESVRGGFAHRRNLGADVDHSHLRAFAEMRQFFHYRLFIKGRGEGEPGPSRRRPT